MTAIDDGKTTWPPGAPASGHPTALLSWLEAEHVKLTCRMAALGDLRAALDRYVAIAADSSPVEPSLSRTGIAAPSDGSDAPAQAATGGDGMVGPVPVAQDAVSFQGRL